MLPHARFGIKHSLAVPIITHPISHVFHVSSTGTFLRSATLPKKVAEALHNVLLGLETLLSKKVKIFHRSRAVVGFQVDEHGGVCCEHLPVSASEAGYISWKMYPRMLKL